MPRILYGVLSGLAATLAMTAAMRRHGGLPRAERYAPPPRGIVEGWAPRSPTTEEGKAAATILSHFAYGGHTGATFGAQGRRSLVTGVGYGLGVWAARYLRRLPAARILTPATRHPAERNALMLAYHALALLAAGPRVIEAAEAGAFRRYGGRLPDVRRTPPMLGRMI